MTIKALFFDYDGVLWDSEVANLQSWQELYAEFGQELSIAGYATVLGTPGGTHLIDTLERSVGHPMDPDAILARRWARKMELVQRLEPRPGVLSYLDAARRMGLSVGVVSTDDMPWIDTGLSILGLRDVWDFIECAGGDVARAKPSPALYLAALDRLGISADEAMAIEDSPNGIRAAKAAGVYCLCYSNAVSRELDLREADLVVGSLDQLPLETLVRLAEGR